MFINVFGVSTFSSSLLLLYIRRSHLSCQREERLNALRMKQKARESYFDSADENAGQVHKQRLHSFFCVILVVINHNIMFLILQPEYLAIKLDAMTGRTTLTPKIGSFRHCDKDKGSHMFENRIVASEVCI